VKITVSAVALEDSAVLAVDHSVAAELQEVGKMWYGIP